MEDFIGLVAVLMIFSIPIIAIWTSFKLKSKKMEMESGGNGQEFKRQFVNLMNENELLRERLKSVEQILSELPQVSAGDKDRLRINIEQSEMTLKEVEKQKAIDKQNKLF